MIGNLQIPPTKVLFNTRQFNVTMNAEGGPRSGGPVGAIGVQTAVRESRVGAV